MDVYVHKLIIRNPQIDLYKRFRSEYEFDNNPSIT